MIQLQLHVFLILISVNIVIGQTCYGANTIWNSCAPAPACKEYCTKDPNEVCTENCVPGCMCDTPGYKFLGIDSEHCIPEDECPICGINEVYKVCGEYCQDYCGKVEEPCISPCVEGCFCKEGFVRQYDSPIAPCILEVFCPPSA